jgi:hypothetical protein
MIRVLVQPQTLEIVDQYSVTGGGVLQCASYFRYSQLSCYHAILNSEPIVLLQLNCISRISDAWSSAMSGSSNQFCKQYLPVRLRLI